MNKWTKILAGLVLIILVIIFGWYSASFGSGTFWNFKHAAWEFFKGGLVWLVFLIGLLFLLLGISELKN